MKSHNSLESINAKIATLPAYQLLLKPVGWRQQGLEGRVRPKTWLWTVASPFGVRITSHMFMCAYDVTSGELGLSAHMCKYVPKSVCTCLANMPLDKWPRQLAIRNWFRNIPNSRSRIYSRPQSLLHSLFRFSAYSDFRLKLKSVGSYHTPLLGTLFSV